MKMTMHGSPVEMPELSCQLLSIATIVIQSNL